MTTRTTLASVGALTLALAVLPGCGSANQNTQPQTFAQARDQEIESERKEFIAEHRERLSELENEIGQLEVRLKHESKFVDNDQRAEWSQELFELRQERERLNAELERAQAANEEEWEEMRGDFGLAFDTFQSGVNKLRDDVMSAFQGGGEEPTPPEDTDEPQQVKMTTHGGLCALDVPDAKADVKRQQGAVVVTITTTDTDSVDQLRQRAKQLINNGMYMPASSSNGGEGQHDKGQQGDQSGMQGGQEGQQGDRSGMAVNARVENIQNGVRVILAPKDKAQLEALETQIKDDMQALGTGRCTTEPQTS